MLLNYLHIALRNAWRNKIYFLINLLGLAIGIASSIIILLFVLDELSFDRHNEHFKDIYRICIRGKIQGNELEAALSNAPMGASLKSGFPEVGEYTRLYTFDGDPVVRYEDQAFIEENFLFREDVSDLADSDSLLENGVMDSTGILELVAFLEGDFGVEMSDAEIVPANLDSIASIAAYLERKQAVGIAA